MNPEEVLTLLKIEELTRAQPSLTAINRQVMTELHYINANLMVTPPAPPPVEPKAIPSAEAPIERRK